MIRLCSKLPRTLTVALSGGIDSVFAVDFLSQRHNVSCAYFDHGTEFGQKSKEWVEDFCKNRGITLITGKVTREKDQKESPEEYWRNERYKFLDKLDGTVVTGHHLNDVIETWIFTSLNGEGKLIPINRGCNIVRPFLLVSKEQIVSYCEKKQLTWLDDPSNNDMQYKRNLIRHKIYPLALEVNSGLGTVLRKKILEKMSLDESKELS